MNSRLKELFQLAIGFIYRYSVHIIFSAVMIWMFLVSGFSTSYIANDRSEHSFFVKDNFLLNISAFFCFILLFFFLGRSRAAQNLKAKLDGGGRFFLKVKRILLVLIFLTGGLIVLSAGIVPEADQHMIMRCAYGLRIKDYTEFLEGGYVYMYPNQIGIVVFLRAFSEIFGDFNYTAFQLFSVIGLVITYDQLSDIAGLLGMSRLSRLCILLFGVFFLPFTLYASFVYGTVPGMACAAAAVKHEMLFFREYKTKDMLKTAFFITFCLIFKSNYLIFFVAVLLYAFTELVKKCSRKILIFMVVVALGGFAQAKALNWYVSCQTGQETGRGVSAWAFLAMGLQDNGGDNKRYGWYNEYNARTFRENGYDTKLQAEEAREYIRERVQYFAAHTDVLLSFQGHKQASQWNNPTYQGFWNCRVCGSAVTQPQWIKRMFSDVGTHRLAGVFDIVQYLCLGGIVLFLFFSPGRTDRECLLLQMIMVGGFVFHLFWEAKCQYVISYFMMMIPLSLKGYSDFCRETAAAAERIREERHYWGRAGAFALLMALTAGMAGWNGSWLINNTIKLEDDTQEYRRYLAFNITDRIEDGVYRISPYTDTGTAMRSAVPEDGEMTADVVFEPYDKAEVRLYTENNKVHFQFQNSGLYLDLYGAEEREGTPVQACIQNDSMAQKWAVKRIEGCEDAYYILIGRKSALTYDEQTGGLYIRQYDEADSQKWVIRQLQPVPETGAGAEKF